MLGRFVLLWYEDEYVNVLTNTTIATQIMGSLTAWCTLGLLITIYSDS